MAKNEIVMKICLAFGFLKSECYNAPPYGFYGTRQFNKLIKAKGELLK